MNIGTVNLYTYGYDQYSRLNKVTTAAGVFNYTHLANSDLIASMTRPNNVPTNYTYETARDLLTKVANGAISTFQYANDAFGRRTSMNRSGSSFTAAGDVTVKNFTNKKIESIMISREGQDFRYYGWLSPWINSGMHGFFSELPSVITLKWCYEDEEIYLQRRFNITHPELLKKYHDDFVGLSFYIVGKECMLLYFFSVYFPEGEFVNYVGFFPEENRWVDLIDFENEYRAIGRK